jgi:uncharacterized membrane protein YccC
MAQCAVLCDPFLDVTSNTRQPNDLMDRFRTTVLARLKPRRPQLGLALRVTLGALLSLGFAQALHLHLPLWAVLTAIIVTQLSVGRSLKTAFDYFVGTIGGVIYGGVITIFVPHSGEVELLAVLALVVAPLALISALRPQLNVATVTGIIVLLVPTMTQVEPLDSAIDRVLEVGVGALTGLAVSFLVLPSRALGLATTSAALTLELMAASLRELLAGLTRGLDNDALHRLQDGIGHSLVKLGEIAGEAESERAAGLPAGPETAPLLRTLLRLRHDLVMIGRAAATPLPEPLQQRLGGALKLVSTAATGYLSASASALRHRRTAPPLHPLQEALAAYEVEVASVRRDGLTRDLTADRIEPFFALGFALDQLQQNFADLGQRLNERALPGKKVVSN